jgi:excisionase family DNA binding protein
MKPSYVTTAELAQYFGVSNATILTMVRSNAIPSGTYMRLGKVFRFDLPAIEQHLLTQQASVAEVEASGADNDASIIEDI